MYACTTAAEDEGQLVALGTGCRCVDSSELSTDGYTMIDSAAVVRARRALKKCVHFVPYLSACFGHSLFVLFDLCLLWLFLVCWLWSFFCLSAFCVCSLRSLFVHSGHLFVDFGHSLLTMVISSFTLVVVCSICSFFWFVLFVRTASLA